MPMSVVNLTFQDPSGTPLANGTVTFELNTDISTAATSGVQVVAKRTVSVPLDTNGSCSVSLWPNASLKPAGSVYFVTAYTSKGLPAWNGQLTVT